MSEIYESTALKFQLPSRKAQKYALDLHNHMREWFGREIAPDIYKPEPAPENPTNLTPVPEEFRTEEVLLGWQFEVEPDGARGLYIYVTDGCDFVGSLTAFLKHLLKTFDPLGFVQFEWGRICTKPEPTCFSGGSAHVTADGVQISTTLDWIQERAAEEAGKLANRTYE
jgi:hypothetical protein